MKQSLLIIVLLLMAQHASAAIQASAAFVREMPPGQPNTAAFLHLHNDGDRPAVLIAASSDSSEQVEIHVHRHQQGMMRMEQVNSVTVPAKGDFQFKPGEYHLMLISLKRSLKAGEQVTIKLEFDNAESVLVKAPVQNIMREHAHH